MNGSARAHLEKVVFAVVAAIVVAGGLASIAIMASSGSAPQDGAPPAPTPNVELTQTVLYRSRIGFQVCARRTLHDCTLTFVRSDGGDRATIRIGPLDIEPADNCETIGATAVDRCSDAGVDPFHELPNAGGRGPTMEWVACAARSGFIYRGGPNTVVVDPRDEEPGARPGQARLQCAEGFKRAAFDNTL